MPVKKPPHVGGLIRKEIIAPLGLSVSEAAIALGVTRQALGDVLNERATLPIDMALRIEKAFGPRMEPLMRMQLEYDLAQARAREHEISVNRYHAPTPDSSGRK
jgi:antitoxin HigA-1